MQRPESGAIEKEVAADHPVVVELQRLDVAGFRRLRDVLDFSFDALHAARLRVGAKVARVQRRVEMIGIADVGQQRARIRIRQRELAQARGHRAQAVLLDGMLAAAGALVQPVVVEIDALHVHAVNAEGMDVGVALASPVDELDAEFEGGVGRLHELLFIEAEHAIEIDDVGDGRFADADRADLVGFHQRDRDVLRDPAGSTARPRSSSPAEPPPAMTICFRRGCMASRLLLLEVSRSGSIM